MYFKFWVITVIIGITFHEIYCSKICCCTEDCRKNENGKTENDGNKQNGIRNESQSTICPSSLHCPSLNRLKQKFSKFSPCPPVNSSGVSCQPPFRNRRPLPPCCKKLCPTSPPIQPVKICPPPQPCPKITCPILPPSQLPNSAKSYAAISRQLGEELNRDTDYTFKNESERQERRKSKEMVSVS